MLKSQKAVCADARDYYVCVYASQVAMCIGANRHKKVSDAVMMMWQRISPASFRDAMRRNNLKTDEDALDALVTSRTDVRALVNKSFSNAHTSTEVSSCYAGALQELEKTRLEDWERQLVDDAVRKNLYTTYGTRAEGEMLEHIRSVLHIPCHTDPTFYKRHMGEVRGVPWYVGGKVDAISDDGNTLIEIKNRVNRLFMRAPAYEVAQVQTYLELLDMERGLLVECLKDEGGVQTNVMHMHRDKHYWDTTVVPKLQKFVGFLVRLLGDPAMQDAFLKSKRPSAMVTHFSD